jgi:hypothetical protein
MSEIYIFLVLALVGIIISCSYVFFFFSIQKLHKSPGDIYLGMSVAEGMFSIK